MRICKFPRPILPERFRSLVSRAKGSNMFPHQIHFALGFYRLFSICRFREVTGRYPEKITMVSFTFKQRRFETLHLPALQWPSDRFKFVGYNPPKSSGFDLEASAAGEQENAAKPFESDPYGCHSEILQSKRKERNPFHRTAPYALSCPEMVELLHHCGPDIIEKEKLPWANLQ